MPDAYNDPFSDYSLYHPQIERFFLENYIFHQDLETGAIFSRSSYGKNWGSHSALYIHRGYFKIYLTNAQGSDIFTGFMPQYSVIYSARTGAPRMGKYLMTNGPTSIYVVPQADYLDWLSQSADLVSHQIEEAFYRRNLSDYPRMMSQGMSSKAKVWHLLLYTAQRFGHPEQEPGRWVLDRPLTNADMASYFDIHPHNVSTCMAQLVKAGLIERSSARLLVPDMNALEAVVRQAE